MREIQEQQERETKLKEQKMAEQRKIELQAQQERDAKIREEQLREQRLRENQTKLQNQQVERNVPINYPNQNNVGSFSPPNMASNPVFPSQNIVSSNLPHQVPISNIMNQPPLTIDPFARISNNNIPDDAFHNRGRPRQGPQVLSPPASRERTIPIKIETQKYSDVSQYMHLLHLYPIFRLHFY